MISCIVFNCAGVNSYDPKRFAGTWKQYSKKAMPQLTTITFHSASLRNLRCPYHATVIKIFEIISKRIVRIPVGAPWPHMLFTSVAHGTKFGRKWVRVSSQSYPGGSRGHHLATQEYSLL